VRAGDPHANVWLGECLELGIGTDADPVAAVDCFRAAAGAGDPHGLAELGRCLLYGIGASADPAAGEAMLRSAAEAGWASALGEIERYWFARGERLLNSGSARLEDAVNCYRKAAELGHRRAARCWRNRVMALAPRRICRRRGLVPQGGDAVRRQDRLGRHVFSVGA
jgi:TPR repeat protein